MPATEHQRQRGPPVSEPARPGRTEGQSLVEFALVLPVFLLLLFGLIDIGRYVFTVNALNQAAREGARLGSVASWANACSGTREACITQATVGRMAGVPPEAIKVDVTCQRYAAGKLANAPVSGCRSNDLLRVQLSMKFQILTPMIGQFVGGAPITGSAEVTVNQ
jgi:hypothetical protein